MRAAALLIFALLTVLGTALPACAGEAGLRELIASLAAARDFVAIEATVNKIAATGDPAAAPVLEALGQGNLHYRKSDGGVFIVRQQQGSALTLLDPLTGAAVGEARKSELQKVKINNALRRAVRAALGSLTLLAVDPARRLDAAVTMFRSPDPGAISVLDQAILRETDPRLKRAFSEARAAAVLSSNLGEEEKRTAVATIAARGDREALALLSAFQARAPERVKADVARELARIEQSLSMWAAAQNIWYGVSLGSVLLLAAIGLAITFGVMGVINMAHGEMVMLGAYTTFLVQEIIRAEMPWLFDASVAIALPLAFLVAALAGLAIERGVIRFLYGRPLETLLATWGLSLIIQQAVRSTFGAQNREVGNPSWMSGAFELGQMTITYNRLFIVLFALAVFAVLLITLNWTRLGLEMRAVTQNRQMAAAMGIRTPRIDAMTFALGSGIAGIAGVALSQIDNVSPNLGQGYIIDSFMVVVFGGVGNLWGTLVGALTLGIVNKLIEPSAGAVLAKILVLVFIILLIQKRPQGLFALRGRAAEA